MPTDGTNKARLFDIKAFPMDAARLVCAVLPLYFRIKRLTPEGTPYRERLHGGAIIAANHTSFADPFKVGVTVWYRRLHFLVGEIVMGNGLRNILLKGVGAIKVDRNGTDIEAVKKSVEVLKKGRLLAVFPQGGIKRDGNIDSVKSGAVFMALRAGVSIVPMYICPKVHWYSRQTVIIGKKLSPAEIIKRKMPTTADIEAVTELLTAELNRCKSSILTTENRI